MLIDAFLQLHVATQITLILCTTLVAIAVLIAFGMIFDKEGKNGKNSGR